MEEIKTMTMTIEKAEKIGYVAKLKGYTMEELMSELKSVWSTYSNEARDNWATILGGLKDKDMVMAVLSKEDDR